MQHEPAGADDLEVALERLGREGERALLEAPLIDWTRLGPVGIVRIVLDRARIACA